MGNEEMDAHSQMFAPMFPPFQNNDVENRSRHSPSSERNHQDERDNEHTPIHTLCVGPKARA